MALEGEYHLPRNVLMKGRPITLAEISTLFSCHKNSFPFLKPLEDTSSHGGGSVWVFQTQTQCSLYEIPQLKQEKVQTLIRKL